MENFKDYKWLISSCLQKSIRRGEYDLAKEYIDFLFNIDRSYLTYRFGTILIEDVGIANPQLVKSYLETKIEKKQIDAKGGLDFFQELTKQACLSVKDRSSCDSAYTASFELSEKIKTISTSRENLETIFLDRNENYLDRINAQWLLLGNLKFKNELFLFEKKEVSNKPRQDQEKEIDNFIEIINKLQIKDLDIIIKNAYLTQRENIFLGFSVMSDIFREEQNLPHSGEIINKINIKHEVYYHKETNLPLISCGIDGHTSEGRQVYQSYLSKSNFTNYLTERNIDATEHLGILKHCLFRVEGHEVNQRLYYPTAVRVMRDCEQKVLSFKAPNLKFSDLSQILQNDIHVINKLRKNKIENKIKFKY